MPVKPTPTALTRPFWEALREGRLTVPRCGSCSRRFFVPEPVCPHCGSADWTWADSAGTGSVYSVTVVHQTPSPDQPTPFALAIVELDEGWTLLTHIVNTAPESVAIGAHVVFAPTKIDGDLTLPTFEPA